MTELTQLRRAKDRAFKHDPHLPLTVEQLQAFQGLRYFPENPALPFTVRLDQSEEQELIQMQTSTGGEQALRHAGGTTGDRDRARLFS